MASSPLRERLEHAFRFDASDLAENRSGRLSARQVARLGAARGAARIALGVFAAVTLASGAFVARSLAPEHRPWALGATAAAAAIGVVLSRSSLAALGSRSVSVAEGLAEADAEDRLLLGGKRLVLGAPGQLEAFEPGAAYRVFYVDGPRALVLSAEALDERVPPATHVQPPGDPSRDPIVALARRARWIPVVIVALSAQMVGVILLARDLARGPRAAVFLAMVAEGVTFAVVTVRWLRRRR
ncbi:MAG TPA: hypothetical protein VNE71_15660 [Myxococcota bacterium]|nr:hypothetical protein [Myxococcota bacterium]